MTTISPTDRLIFTLLFSVIIHLVIVLGISFEVTSPLTNQPKVNLEITLVKQQTVDAPEQADFLAQENNQGSGETEEKTAEPDPDKLIAANEQQAGSPPKAIEAVADISPTVAAQVVVADVTEQTIETKEKTAEAVKQEIQTSPNKLIVQQQAERQVKQVAIEQDEKPQLEQEIKPQPPQITARDLILPNLNEIALLDRQLTASAQALSNQPKKRRISASTKEYAAAAYMRSWEMKVERIGNFNYPQEARQKHINGSLMLTVDIKPDGSVPADGIVVSRSSGYPVLDNAAIRIVRLGAPYSVIPDNVLQGNDMLTIIRTWKFETNKGLSTR